MPIGLAECSEKVSRSSAGGAADAEAGVTAGAAKAGLKFLSKGSRACLLKQDFLLKKARFPLESAVIRCLLFLAHEGPTGFNPYVIRERS
jgi:hypothetical protein